MPVRVMWDTCPYGQDQGGSSRLYPSAFQMPSLNEREEKKLEMSEVPTLKEKKNLRKKHTHICS